MTLFDPTEHPHRRLNPLTGEHVLVSPHRTRRPWQGKQERGAAAERPTYDPGCYLCPGNARAGGEHNPQYRETFVFTNDFAALLPETPAAPDATHELLRTESVSGTCRVVCFSPRHDLTLAEMDAPGVRRVIDLWADQFADLAGTWRWVQVFENKGEVMGCSNPHPHGQIWSSDALPNEPRKEDVRQREYAQRHGRPLLLEYAALEAEARERVVAENAHWLAVVPFWAVWPFETMLLPRRHVLRLPELSGAERDALAEVLRALLIRYDNLFETSFPYSMGWHAAPGGAADVSHWQLHAHYYPPLLRSATVKKFLVGYEMLGEVQRDLTAEQAAGRLRDLPAEHYRAAAAR